MQVNRQADRLKQVTDSKLSELSETYQVLAYHNHHTVTRSHCYSHSRADLCAQQSNVPSYTSTAYVHVMHHVHISAPLGFTNSRATRPTTQADWSSFKASRRQI